MGAGADDHRYTRRKRRGEADQRRRAPVSVEAGDPVPRGEAVGRDNPRRSAPGRADSDLDLWHDLQEAVGQLPVDQREVFALRFYHGWDQGQIAELLQVSTKTVGRMWVRAQLRLGELLGGRGLPGGDEPRPA